MKLKLYPGSYATRHALSVGLAVLTAIFVNHYFSYTQSGWVMITALLVSQTTRGTPIRQGISFFLVIMVAALFASILQLYAPVIVMQGILCVTFVICGYELAYRRQSGKPFYFVAIFMLMTIISLFSPVSAPELIRYQMADVMMGAIIGVSFALFVFPVRLNKEFYQALLPVLTALMDYMRTFETVFAKEGENNRLLVEKRLALESVMQNSHIMYPEWVYEAGFNPALRASYRFFLVHLERLTDLMIAIDGLVTSGLDRAFLSALSASLVEVMQKNLTLLAILQTYFQLQTLLDLEADFINDVSALENQLRQLIPQKIELLDVSQDYIDITALVRDVRDTRELLLKLASALPDGK
jgi:hypothetical protein